MAVRSDEMARFTGAAGIARSVTSLLSGGDARGRTADDIAAALDLPSGGEALQAHLEALVRRGILDRRGISRGALYTLAAAPMRTARRVRRVLRVRSRVRAAVSRASTPAIRIGRSRV